MWWDDLPTPADPWADSPTVEFATPEPTLPIEPEVQTYAGAKRKFTRPLFGAVYMCQTATDPDKYVGRSGRAPWTRVKEHRERQPWGSEILPGKQGYRVLCWVEESGLGRRYDEANLRYHEALMIQRHNPTENASRPVPVPPAEWIAREDAKLARAATVSTRAKLTGKPARPIARFRVFGFCFWVTTWTAAMAWLLNFSPEPLVPWLGAPVLGLVLGWATLWEIRRRYDQLTHPKARPPRRRRRTRRRRNRW